MSKEVLPQGRVQAPEQAQVSSLAQTRDKRVTGRTAVRNTLHGILTAHGRPSRKEAYNREAALQEGLALEWESSVGVELEGIVAQIRSLPGGITRLEAEIQARGGQLPGHTNLTRSKGIGGQSAAIFLAVIGDIGDFASADKLARDCGSVPRVARSNQTAHLGAITKRGSKLGRTTLVQCTLGAKRYSPYLRRFYERVKRRRGSGKAIIATARKFLGVSYRTLKYRLGARGFPELCLSQTLKASWSRHSS
ncbi:MAG: transposase [Thermodesulfobacteriota bacterium]|jgi:transposase